MNTPSSISLVEQSDGRWQWRMVDAFGRLIMENYDLPDFAEAMQQVAQAFILCHEVAPVAEAPTPSRAKPARRRRRTKE